VFQSLRQSGSIAKSDLTGEKTYLMADGHMGKSQTFIIRSLRVGDVTVRNVEAGVGGPIPLLGQSFLMKFKSWSIDNEKNVIVLRKLEKEIWK
jgi:predicted aspartyl protease